MNGQNPQRDPTSQINGALGLFLLCFGVVIVIAVFFTETVSGKIANLAAGLVIGGVGLGMLWGSRARSRPS
jgi:hypothetical protein